MQWGVQGPYRTLIPRSLFPEVYDKTLFVVLVYAVIHHNSLGRLVDV